MPKSRPCAASCHGPTDQRRDEDNRNDARFETIGVTGEAAS